MDWIEGINYVTFMKAGDLRSALEYIETLLGQLNVLHRLGIYHHDIKPSNYIYNPKSKKGTLIDFGTMLVVKAIINQDEKFYIDNLKDSSVLTQEQHLIIQRLIRNQMQIAHHLTGFSNIGTMAYSSIEKITPQIVNYEPNSIYFNHAADIWSVGCILVELCLGITPLFSMCSLNGKCPKGNRIEVKDQTVSSLLKLGSILGRQLVEEEITSMSYYTLHLPETIDEEGIDISKFSFWHNLDRSAAYLEKLLAVMLSPNPRNRLSAVDIVSCIQDLLAQV